MKIDVPFENEYIALCKNIFNILLNSTEYFSLKGKWKQKFQNSFPIVLEIGTGQGNFFANLVSERQQKNYIGMELRWKRLYSTYIKAVKHSQKFFLIKEYAQQIENIFSEGEISEIYIYFPDPWPKERQKQNRLFQRKFLNELYTICASKGKLYIKTDDHTYFQQLLEELKNTNWEIHKTSFDYENDENIEFHKQNITEFEGIWRGHKKQICYLEGGKN